VIDETAGAMYPSLPPSIFHPSHARDEKAMSRRWMPWAALTLASLAGCGSSDGISGLVPVSGIVTMDGKPLEGATISFVPEAKNEPSTPGSDMTGPGGTFKAMYRNRPGLAPGKYRVVVEKAGGAADGKKLPDAIAKDPYMAKMAGLNKQESPPAYTDASKTPLSVVVGKNGESGLTFDLKSTAK